MNSLIPSLLKINNVPTTTFQYNILLILMLGCRNVTGYVVSFLTTKEMSFNNFMSSFSSKVIPNSVT